MREVMLALVRELIDGTDANGNQVAAHSSATFTSSTLVFNGKGASLIIGKNSKLTKCSLSLGGNSRLWIGDNCIISGKLAVGLDSKIIIESDVTVTSNITMRAVECTQIEIGADSMFGSEVVIRTTDGHPIYDAQTRVRLNDSRSIRIGRHVWLADRVVILKGVEVGSGAVVGVGAVVTKSIDPGSIAVGNPARVVKKGIVWERSPGIRSEYLYD